MFDTITHLQVQDPRTRIESNSESQRGYLYLFKTAQCSLNSELGIVFCQSHRNSCKGDM